MNTMSLDSFWQLLYLRNVKDREQILLEAVRVVRTYKRILKQKKKISDTPENKESLFLEMQSVSERYELGHFPGDRNFFYDLYFFADKLDLIELLVQTSRNDRSFFLAPEYLMEYLVQDISLGTRRVLLAEAEKLAIGLQKTIAANPQIEFTLTTERHIYYKLFSAIFEETKNVKIVNQSIYRELLEPSEYDVLITLPSLGIRYSQEEIGNKFISRESECIAVENLTRHLSATGKLMAVLPAKVTFASGTVQEFRKWIMAEYHVGSIYSLPDGTFRPYASIKTYLMSFNKKVKSGVTVGKIKDDNLSLSVAHQQWVSDEEFNRHDDWRVELYLDDDNEAIQKYKTSTHEKVRLKDVAEIFRGKSVLKDDVQPGKIKVMNISNMDDDKMDFQSMDTINEDARKVKRYQLEKDDILLACRGTNNKVAIFMETDHVVIASANIIVLRIREKFWPMYLKIFLDSPIGQLLIKSFQRGTTVMNINPNDIGEMEIPLLPIGKQQQFVLKFIEEQERYRKKKAELEDRWEKDRTELYEIFVGS